MADNSSIKASLLTRESSPEEAGTVAERVAHILIQRIAAGAYLPHSYLPPHRELAQEFQTSRTTVAAALAILAREGLTFQAQGRGTRVLPPGERLTKNLVGVVHSITENELHTRNEDTLMLDAIGKTLSRLGYRHEVNRVVGEPRISADELVGSFGAVLFVESHAWAKDTLLELERRRIPLVVANMEMDVAVSGTRVDHRKVGYAATKALLALGHRRIALITRPSFVYFYGRHREGYAAAIEEAGIPVDESLIAVCEASDPLAAYFAARPLLGAAAPPTAIVAARDVLAQGAHQAATEKGLTVGHDVSIIGFDDLTWPQGARLLTTFREPCFEMGTVAAEMLAERIVNGWRPPERREIESPLILRRSAGPPAASEPAGEEAAPVTLKFVAG